MPKPIPPTEITLLGTGTSTGVPLMFCKCRVCRSKDPKNNRLRAAAWVRTQGKSFLIDTSTDLRQQAMRHKIPRVDAVLYTHPHADHIHGIDELRSFNFIQRESIPAYGNDWTYNELNKKFEYIFKPGPVEGGGIPQIKLHQLSTQAQSIDIQGVSVIPVSLSHGSMETVGYRIGKVAYVTDCSYIPKHSLDRLKGLSVLILDCLRIAKHGTHFNLDQALEAAREIGAKRTYFTHMSHDFEYASFNKTLPPGIRLGYDGLRVKA